jgi:hypothetical protein
MSMLTKVLERNYDNYFFQTFRATGETLWIIIILLYYLAIVHNFHGTDSDYRTLRL